MWKPVGDDATAVEKDDGIWFMMVEDTWEGP